MSQGESEKIEISQLTIFGADGTEHLLDVNKLKNDIIGLNLTISSNNISTNQIIQNLTARIVELEKLISISALTD